MSPLAFRPSSATLLMGLVLTLALPACGGGSESEAQPAADAGDSGDGGATRVAVDPCALISNPEIAEQLFLAVSPAERSSWTTPEFEITATEVEAGIARQCEYRFQSRYAVGGGPVWHSDFSVMVFRADAIGVPERNRLPVAGAGPEVFRSKGERVYYVTKGGLAATLTAFPGTHEAGEDAGRVALLRRIAERLP